MAHLALYREWRPKTFDEVVEQKQAVHALRQSVISGQIAHAYLFSGTRGTGKTTMAKIFSRAINCLQPIQGNPCNQCDICRAALEGNLMDIVEMDAASNNSVDNIRRICDEIIFMPSQARFKVYIIDEVHMLSAGAFNALLKTLEEPPAHAVFILATTESHRIPATILSRCQRYEFRRIPLDSMVERLDAIAKNDAIDITPEAQRTIAALADGALRDAISILDQARSAFPPPVTHDNVLSLVGVVRDQFLQQVASALIDGEIAELLQLVDQLVMAGRDLARFVTDLAQHLRNLLVCQVATDDRLLVRVNSEALADMKQLAGQVSSDRLIVLIRGLSALLSDLRWASDGRTALEVGMIRLMDYAPTPVRLAEQTIEKKSEPPLPEAPPEDNSWTDDPLPEPELKAEPTIAAAEPVSIHIETGEAAVKTSEAGEITAEPSITDVADLWTKVLDNLQEMGHMTLYLFSRPARPILCQGTLQLVFAAAETVHYQEVNQASALKVLRESVRRLSGQDLAIAPIIAGQDSLPSCPDTNEDNWVEKVRKTAQALGIPMKVEE
ncbi:MAG: DNA polymerase III subunit gamma/tau [Bacillota bacterium]|nr:DNA polymerase III subunit gamma/tau [Bacillota bacterium]